jgi:hypothetical protein
MAGQGDLKSRLGTTQFLPSIEISATRTVRHMRSKGRAGPKARLGTVRFLLSLELCSSEVGGGQARAGRA